MQRVEDVLDLKFCTDGVQTALQDEDFEKVKSISYKCKLATSVFVPLSVIERARFSKPVAYTLYL